MKHIEIAVALFSAQIQREGIEFVLKNKNFAAQRTREAMALADVFADTYEETALVDATTERGFPDEDPEGVPEEDVLQPLSVDDDPDTVTPDEDDD